MSPNTDQRKIAGVFSGALSKSDLYPDPFLLFLDKKSQFFLEWDYIDTVISRVNIPGLSISLSVAAQPDIGIS